MYNNNPAPVALPPTNSQAPSAPPNLPPTFGDHLDPTDPRDAHGSSETMSLFENGYGQVPTGSLSLEEFLEGIKEVRWSNEVAAVRRDLREKGKEAYDRSKKLLPVVTTSGIVDGQRKRAAEEGRFTHSGLLQIDLDEKDHPGLDVEELRRRCQSSPYCLAVWESPSGLGVKALVRIEADVGSHARSFLAAEQHFAGMGLKIDSSTRDPVRMMFVSSDPNIWVNPRDPVVLPPLQPVPASAQSDDGDGATEFPERGSTAAEIGRMLAFIPPRPPYGDWLRVSWAVLSAVDAEEAIPLLKNWSPEENEGEYAKLHRETKPEKGVGLGTLVFLAKKHGYVAAPIFPDDVLPLPGGGVTHDESSTAIFKVIAPTQRLFMRSKSVCEIAKDGSGIHSIDLETPERFVDFVSTLGQRVAKRECTDSAKATGESRPKNVKWRTQNMPVSTAKIALQSQAARDLLPPLRQIVRCPLIVEKGGGQCEILKEGYHRHGGGTFVGDSISLEEFPGGYVVAALVLKSLFTDFDFATPSDFARAMSCMISPALKMGGIITDDFPLDVAEADQSQSGKTYRQKMVAALYNEIPSVITARNSGVGGFDESVASALLAGRPFITMDNIRGNIDSPLLEMALRGHGHADCRGFRANGRVDLSPFIFQLSTNGAEFTKDLANRCVMIRIRKRSGNTAFKSYPEGDVLAHISKRRRLHLACVFTLVREWVARGKPETTESRHDFRKWTRSLDWIVQNLCGLAPLMDGHREEQMRTANPKRQWLRSVLMAVQPIHFDRALTTVAIVGVAENAGIDFPGGRSQEASTVRAGKIFAVLFNEAGGDTLEIDGFEVARTQGPGEPGGKFQKLYLISKK